MSSALEADGGADRRGEASLESLLGQIAERDEVAFARLYELTSRRVFGLVLRILRDPDAAADAALETYWTAWRNAASFDAQRGRVMAWLLTIARSRAIDRLRAQRRRSATELPELDRVEPADPGPSPEVVSAQAERCARVRTALGSLPEPQRVAIETAFFAGLTHVEVAAELGEPVGTVKSRIRLGLHSLRRQLNEIG